MSDVTEIVTYVGEVASLNVNMSNQLVRMAHGLSLPEKRVVSVCMAKLDSMRAESGRYKFKISAAEFAKEFDLDNVTAYEQLKAVGDKLMARVARTIEKTRRGDKERKWVWVSGVTYHHGEGWIEVAFSPEMTPHLVALSKEFTSYKLRHTVDLRSVYSWRLFELLMQFKKTGLLRISVDDFCFAMEAPPSCVKDFGQLRRRVVDPAVAELILKNSLVIDYTATKNGGRKVTGLEFKFYINPQASFSEF
jgi:plasmid replication initiation protein